VDPNFQVPVVPAGPPASLSGYETTTTIAEIGGTVWSGSNYVFTSLPDILIGSTMFQSQLQGVEEDTVISITVEATATFFLAFLPSASGGFASTLPDAAWNNLQATVTYENPERNGKMELWTKTLEPGTYELPATSTSQASIVVFVKRQSGGD